MPSAHPITWVRFALHPREGLFVLLSCFPSSLLSLVIQAFKLVGWAVQAVRSGVVSDTLIKAQSYQVPGSGGAFRSPPIPGIRLIYSSLPYM